VCEHKETGRHTLIIRLLFVDFARFARVLWAVAFSFIPAAQQYLFGCHKLSLLCIISFCLDLAGSSSEENVMGVEVAALLRQTNGIFNEHTLCGEREAPPPPL